MTHKWLKRIGIIISIPIVLFCLLIVLLYIPPIQNYLCREAVAYASKSTGMQVGIQRIDLRFPLRLQVRGVEVVQAPDTLLALETLKVSVKLIPLFSGKVELNNLTLEGARVNTLNLLEGMRLQGNLGQLSLSSDAIDLTAQVASVRSIDLRDTHIQLCMNPVEEAPEDTTASSMDWLIQIQQIDINDVGFVLQMPADTLYLATTLKNSGIRNVTVDLGKQYYGLEKFFIKESVVNYQASLLPPQPGFDPSHITLDDINVEINDVMMQGKEMKAQIKECTLRERSGFQLNSLSGLFYSDSLSIHLPALSASTPYSEITAEALIPWDLSGSLQQTLRADFSARIGKQDVFLFLPGFTEDIKKSFPTQPFTLRLGAQGSLQELRVSQLSAELPTAFTLTGAGEMRLLTDSINRTAAFDLNLETDQLDFLKSLAGMAADTSFVIPRGMQMNAKLGMKGPQYMATLKAQEGNGVIDLNATLNSATETYQATLAIDSFQIAHFLPKDSIGRLAAEAKVEGRGLDFTSPQSTAKVSLNLNELEYARYHLTGVNLTADLKNAIISAAFVSQNELLKAKGQASYNLRNTGYTEATANMRIDNVNLYELGIIERPVTRPFEVNLKALTKRDSVGLSLVSRDLQIDFRSRTSLERLMNESTGFVDLLMAQVDARLLDHAALRRALPSAALRVKSGHDNSLVDFLALNNIKLGDMNVGLVATPRIGINGRAAIHGLQVDTLQLDTIFLVAHQDTSRLRLRVGVDNGPANPHISFKSSITGEIRSDDAEVTLQFANAQGETGLLLGVNARPVSDGIKFSFIPAEPVVAFKRFSLKEHNQVFLQNDFRVIADVEMLDSAGMGVRVHSLPDSLNLQNLDVEVRRIDLTGISRILPYFPSIEGLFSLEANIQQSVEKEMQVAAEAIVGDLFYNNVRIGNIGLGATWLPNGDTQYVDTYLTNEGEQILTATGTYDLGNNGLDINTVLKHFPLYFSSAFIPIDVLELSGDMDGSLAITGSADAPLLNGEFNMHGVDIYSAIYGARFKLDERPLRITNSRFQFDNYAIYSLASTHNPFTVNGYVDLSNLSNGMADLTLAARNYPLLNARRSNISELYGRVNVDLNSTLKGPLSALIMRGNLNILPNTDVTYILKDSPLTVQDRLGDLVEFTSFAADSIPVPEEESTPNSWGGIDVFMTINIDPAVKVGVDLSGNESSYINLEGGGDLSFIYTPQGEMSLTGRYEFTGGAVKYALPVIPLKKFTIKSGSYVEWVGDVMDPTLNLIATERTRAKVQDADDNTSRMVNFDVSIVILDKLKDLNLAFNLEAPEDRDIQQQLDGMGPEERGKQAVAMMVTGIYLAGGGGSGGGFNIGTALGGLLQGQLAGIAGTALKSVNISFGMDNYDDGTGTRTDYSFRYAQGFFNDRVQVVIGGRVSTGGDAATRDESFIDNISLEYRLDSSSTRYLRLFHNKNYESLLEGEITETGGGIVLRKKVNKLGELFIFRRKKN